MVNPLQRAKRKNASKRINTRKTKSAAKDRAKAVSFAGVHPVIQANWDKNLTLRQNYERMGLLANLNGKAGGEAVSLRDPASNNNNDDDDDEQKIEISYRSIEDFEKMPAVSRERDNVDELDEDDEDFDVDGPVGDIDPKSQGIGSRLGHRKAPASRDAALLSTRKKITRLPEVMQALEYQANLGEAPRVYHNSDNEVEVLMALQKKYGDDYQAMQRDTKINTYQLSAGQLKKKFKKWHANQ
ncbi:Nucleolar protein 16 [Rhizoclosmatium sp. JEL0117]|nr:Nucleolar protein 16 [Rhizoclosmatium sp. JEL0117]